MIDQRLAADAVNTVMARVYLPTFLAKLAADYDIRPQTQEDIANLIQIAAILSGTRKERQAIKKASAEEPAVTTFLRDAANNISQAATGITTTDLQAEAITYKVLENMVKQDDHVKQAAVVYGYLASQR